MSDLRARLQSSLGAGYTIEGELGGGGMSRVFVAMDRELGRRVVIKTLPSELAAGLSARRFDREIKLAASLQQANIVPVLSAGVSDGVPHYTMPFVDGLSLRERLERDGRLPLAEAVSVLRDIARALAYAHERGVVHRDIKPENVLLSGGAAVVIDFGIAKAVATARSEGAAEETRERSTTTQAGVAVGTPAYMAPEQISADPTVDHRADIYSFGCVAYELLAGTPPFHGKGAHRIIAAHIGEAPVPVGERNPDVPPAIVRVVMQCLEKDPTRRPGSAVEMLRALEDVSPASGLARLRQRLTPRQRAAVLLAVALPVVVIGALLARDSLTSAPDAASVAVIPFFNLTGDSTEQYLADGMADGLATALGKVPGMRVVARSLSFRYGGQRELDPHEVGRALAADHVLQGAVRRAGGRIQVSVNLVRASDNSEVWAESYERPAGDAWALQNAITREVVASLGIGGRGAVAVAASASSGTSDADAYDRYLRGRFLLQRRGPGVRQAIENFESAVERDPNFAHAHASLALALQLTPYFESVSASSLRDRSLATARRALALDSTLAEAHTALAMVHQHAYEWELAEESYRRAVSFDPSEADPRIQYGRFLFYTGRFGEAFRQFERARELDPYSAVASAWMGHLLDLSGDRARGLAELNRAMEIDSTNPATLGFLADAHIAAGDTPTARRYVEHLARAIPRWRFRAAALLADLGEREPAVEMARALEAEETPPVQVYTMLANLYASLRDTLHAIDALERATAAGEIWPTYYSLSERSFDPLRRHPRFAAVVRRAGLNEVTFTSSNGGRSR